MPDNGYGQYFAQGMQAGMAARARKRQHELDARRQEQDELDREVDREFRRKRMREMEVEHEMRKADAARWVEAEGAFERFGEVSASIDWSSPDAVKEYQQAVRLHLPTMLKHETTLKKYEALNRTFVDSARYSGAKQTELQMLDLQKQLTDRELGPEGMTLFDDVKSGKMTKGDALAKAREMMDAHDAKKLADAKALRSAGRTPQPTMSESVELKDIDEMIDSTQKALDAVAPGGALPATAPGNAAKIEQAQKLSNRLLTLKERKKELAGKIDSRGAAGAPDPDASKYSSGGPQAPRTPGAPGGRAVNRYKIEVLNP